MILDILSVAIVVFVLYAIICIPVGLFNLKVFQAANGAKCTGLNLIRAFTPFYNIVFSRSLAYGRVSIYRIVLIVCGLLLTFRIVSLALISLFPILIVYSSLTTILCIAIYIILYIVNAVDFCRMFNCGFFVTTACVIIAPMGYYMLSTQVLGYFRNVEDEVSGRFGT